MAWMASCSSPSDDIVNIDESEKDDVSLVGKSFSNTETEEKSTNLNTDYNEAKELLSLVETKSGIKKRVQSIEVDSSNTKASLFYTIVTKYTLDFISKDRCNLTKTRDNVAVFYDAIKYKTYIQFEMSEYSLSTPSYIESIGVTRLVIGSKHYELWGYGYYNTAYKLDMSTGEEKTNNEKTETVNYTYKIVDDNIEYYNSDGALSFTSNIGLSNIKTSDGRIFTAK